MAMLAQRDVEAGVAHHARGVALLEAGKVTEAVVELQRAVEVEGVLSDAERQKRFTDLSRAYALAGDENNAKIARVMVGSGLATNEKTAPTLPSTSSPMLGSIDPEVIRQTVRAHDGDVRRCADLAPAQPRGTLILRWVIDGTGVVRQALVVESTLQPTSLHRCLANEARSWRFPAPIGGGIVVVTYPFTFSWTT